DRWACAVYRKNFGEILEADVRSVDPREIPDADMLVAGFPCQPFSYAGKRTGFRDPRGTLFFEVARILKARRFPLVLLENVKGLLSAQGGECFAEVLNTLRGLGYGVEWAVLDSRDFGVPQRRERVFVVGHLGGPAEGGVLADLGAGQGAS
ncbi:MAG: DNA (cytosine-5-)-methyltransferase, partial [Candidatus Methanomethylicaceae archaeon]